jgi:hypothetical protein
MTMSNKDDHGLNNAQCGYDNIREMVAALRCDYDRLAELRDSASPDEAEELAQLESDAGECSDADEAREMIHADALEVCVRSDWHTSGDRGDASEFYILLTTGGPALRIRGELDEHGEPSRAWLEYQDWGTPWSRLINDSNGETVAQDVLLAYASCFYFGEA